MDNHIQLLQTLLQKEELSPVEVRDGVVACFIKTNRAFVQRRLGNVDIQKVDSALENLMNPIFEQYQIDPECPDLLLLKRAQEVLEAQSGFEADPELIKMHKNVIGALFASARR
jgi:hypothetical protein